MAKSSASFGRLHQRLWNNHDVSMRVIWSWGLDSVQTTGEKTPCLNDVTSDFDHENNLDWLSDKQEILERIELPYMEDLLIRKNLRWTGQLMRVSLDRISKQIIYSQLSSHHKKGGHAHLQFTNQNPETERNKYRLMYITLTANR